MIPKLGERVHRTTAIGDKKIGTVVYINKHHNYYVVQFTGLKGGTYREGFNFYGG